MTTLTASKARSKLFDLVKSATAAHEIYRIHHRTGDVVLPIRPNFRNAYWNYRSKRKKKTCVRSTLTTA